MTERLKGRPRSFARTRSGRWHRSIGVLFGLIFAFLALTGVGIHHASDFGFDETVVRNPSILGLWGVEASFQGVATPSGWVAADGRSVYPPTGESFPARELRHAVSWQEGLAIAADEELYLLTPSGDLIDRWDTASLPGSVERLGISDDRLALEIRGTIFLADDALLTFAPAAVHRSVSWGEERTALPEGIASTLRERGAGPGLSIERILLDLHSGRILGAAGPWLLDLVTLALTFVVFTGLVGWWRGTSHRQRRKAPRATPQEGARSGMALTPSASTRSSDRRSA